MVLGDAAVCIRFRPCCRVRLALRAPGVHLKPRTLIFLFSSPTEKAVQDVQDVPAQVLAHSEQSITKSGAPPGGRGERWPAIFGSFLFRSSKIYLLYLPPKTKDEDTIWLRLMGYKVFAEAPHYYMAATALLQWYLLVQL